MRLRKRLRNLLRIEDCRGCAAREKRLRSSRKRLREVAQLERLREAARAVAQDEGFHPGWYSTVAQGCALRRKRLRKVCGIFLDTFFLDIIFFL